jgi:hypothetical protein
VQAIGVAPVHDFPLLPVRSPAFQVCLPERNPAKLLPTPEIRRGIVTEMTTLCVTRGHAV